jgi:hypothetical protein
MTRKVVSGARNASREASGARFAVSAHVRSRCARREARARAVAGDRRVDRLLQRVALAPDVQHGAREHGTAH